MHILITGGTGFIGQTLVQHWLQAGHQITILTRNPMLAKTKFGNKRVIYIKDLPENNSSNINAVVNLAGSPIIDKRWTNKHKQVLIDSRVETTKKLVDWIAKSIFPPNIFISASAIGYYGTQNENSLEKLTEDSPPTSEFQSQLCQQWEAASANLAEYGVRRVVFRLGVVFSKNGGSLSKMLMPFKYYLGGRTGSGKQKMSWVHIDDVVGAFTMALKNDNYQGAYNLTAPQPVNNTDLIKMFAVLLDRPTYFTVPEKLLYLLRGERADLLCKGQHVVPKALTEVGFRFRYKYAYRAVESCIENHHQR